MYKDYIERLFGMLFEIECIFFKSVRKWKYSEQMSLNRHWSITQPSHLSKPNVNFNSFSSSESAVLSRCLVILTLRRKYKN
jgi:hypothetical protein